MSRSPEISEHSAWGWYVGAPLLAVLLVHLPILLSLTEFAVMGTNNIYGWLDANGIVDALEPIYRITLFWL